MDKKLIIANWKNHPDSLAEAEQILEFINDYIGTLPEKNLDLIFCPPFVFIEEVAKLMNTSYLVQDASLGAQDIASEENATMTGEISGPMLRNLGVRYVIVGHSERRWKIGESDDMVNKKLKLALSNELTPIVCVGERERGENSKEFLEKQINKTFAGLSAEEINKCLIAYEPVWAISTNPDSRPDTPESALKSISTIKEILGSDIHVLYGGSVNSKNVKDFTLHDQIAGVLVGGASIRKEEFVEILKQV